MFVKLFLYNIINLGNPIIVFRPDVAVSNENDETYMGKLTDFEELNKWVHAKCVPLVR